MEHSEIEYRIVDPRTGAVIATRKTLTAANQVKKERDPSAHVVVANKKKDEVTNV